MADDGTVRGSTPYPRYVLEGRIARGGMGEIFRARAITANGAEMPVVVKRILPQLASSSALVEMFAAEARLMTELVHDNIVRVLDFGRGEASEYFLVLELIDGVDLGRLRQSYEAGGEHPPIGLMLFIAEEVLRGLAYAHGANGSSRGLVHRDISPENVLLSQGGAVKIADFGVALASGAEPPAADEPLVGKPRYMAPEQLIGGSIDARTDLFALGVVLFEALSGSSPFAGETLGARQAAAYAGEIRSLRELRPDASPELEALVRRACAASPADRFHDADEMASAVLGLRRLHPPRVGAAELAGAVRVARVRTQSLRPPPGSSRQGAELTRISGASDGTFTLRIPRGG